MTEKLLPCPFCGESDVQYLAGDGKWPRVECQECGATGSRIDLSKQEVIRRWNTRRSDAPSTLEPFTADDAWHDLVEKDDRNSPEEYPEMCLITQDELRYYMQRAAPPPQIAANTVEPVAIPAGYALVPLIPTAAMIDVGRDNNPTQWGEGTDRGFAADVANDIYVSMVGAAPTTSPEPAFDLAAFQKEAATWETVESEATCKDSLQVQSAPEPDAVLDQMASILGEIEGLTTSLRCGGPDPMDLQDLSDSLSRACELATAAGNLISAIAADPVSDAWNDISTARLDGKPFLARYQWLGEHRFMVIRRSLKGPWWIKDGSSQTVGGERDAIQFTDWQPLPIPPLSRQDGEGGGPRS